MFEDHYIAWRRTRIEMVERLFGRDFFRGKKMLELGCGQGHIGKHFREWGAEVVFADGRREHIEAIKAADPSALIAEIDHEKEWIFLKFFDIIIHWGLLYHLNNWRQDITCTLKHANLVFLESEVCDSDDPRIEVKIAEHIGYDQALHGIGSRPSAAMIEAFVTSLGANITRYDDERLNSGIHTYDWKVNDSKGWRHGLRRFWIIEKPRA